MKNLTINVNGISEKVEPITVKSVNLMWIKVKELFKQFPDAQIVVDEDGKPFKDLKQIKKASGKLWMVNSVKETCRKYIPKTQKKDEPVAAVPTTVEETPTTVEEPVSTEEPSLNDVEDMLKGI